MRTRLAERVRVGKSAIGRGVFAKRAFRKGQNVGEIQGEILMSLDAATTYCVELDETRSLEPAAPFRFLNHSCDPNCEVISWDEPGMRDRLYLLALRTIRTGEELLIDYAWHADAAIRCQCGSKVCRGWVVDAEQLAQLLRREALRRDRRNRRKREKLATI